MKALRAEAEHAVWALRLETSGLWGSTLARRSLAVKLASLERAMAAGGRRRASIIAAALDLRDHGLLRDLVMQWRTEDERRENLADVELWRIEAAPQPIPLDARLWGAYFDAIAAEQPLAAVAASAIWEELRRAAHDLTRPNTGPARRRFAAPDAGTARLRELIDVCCRSTWDREERAEIAAGAAHGRAMGLRLVRWALGASDVDAPAVGSLTSTRGAARLRW